MTAIELALHKGEYRHAQTSILRFPLHQYDPEASAIASRRFLIRIISRAVLDVCMYPEDNEHHDTARSWLLGRHDAAVDFSELASIVDLDSIETAISAMANAEGIHRDQIRDMKKQLYNWSEDDRN